MPASVLGLPTHVLVIHAVVVLLPLTAVLLVASAFSARARSRAGALLPLAGVLCLVLTPVATSSGEALQARLPANPQIQAHAAAGDGLLPWAVALAVASVAVWSARWVAGPARRGSPSGSSGSRTAVQRPVRELAARSPLSVALAVLATTAAVGTTVQVVNIGHLGAKATWGYVADLPPR